MLNILSSERIYVNTLNITFIIITTTVNIVSCAHLNGRHMMHDIVHFTMGKVAEH